MLGSESLGREDPVPMQVGVSSDIDPGTVGDDLADVAWCEMFAIANAPDLVVLADPALRVMWANGAAGRLLGHDPMEFRGHPVMDFIHPDDLTHAVGAISEASRADGYHIAARLRLLHSDGHHVACRVTANTVERADGMWFVLGIRTVGDESAIENRRRRLRGLATTFYVDCASMEWVDEPVRSAALLGALGSVLDAESVEVAELTTDADTTQGVGSSGEGGSLHPVAAWVHDDNVEAEGCREHEEVDLEALRSVPCEYTHDACGHRVRLWLESNRGAHGVATIDLGDHPEQWDDANADVVALMCSSLLATVRRCTRERSVALAATRDPLTGLLNRSAMRERLEELLSASQMDGESLAVFFADLNDFKALNDTAGHKAGDEVLRSVADALRRVIRPGDLAARVGGDEFVVVMMTRRRSLDRLVERLRGSVESVLRTAGGVGVAIGAITVRDGESAEELLERADVAMYADKRRSGADADRRVPPGSVEGSELSNAMESIAIMLAVDSRARLMNATRAAYTVFGFDPDASAGMDVMDLVHPDDRSFAAAAFAHLLSITGPGEPIEIRVTDADGGSHHVQVAANNQLANPEIRGVVLTLTEQTDLEAPARQLPLTSG